ncbi:MAG: AraC family transcriptional regulator [Pseudomonadota bacterium]|nr:AraC family transcriptional regulator [Pseudomonadota bacterium]
MAPSVWRSPRRADRMIATRIGSLRLPRTSMILLPRTALGGCVFAAIVRDTRGVALTDAERFNYFPASPLVTLTRVFEGETRMALGGAAREAPTALALGAVTLSGPQSRPFTSWNPGPVFAISIGFYPDAWTRLTGVSPATLADISGAPVPHALRSILESGAPCDDIPAFWRAVEDALDPLWAKARQKSGFPSWSGGDKIADWTRSLLAQSAVSGPGRSLRAWQRRLRHWTGLDGRSLAFHARLEELHALVKRNGTSPPADVALDAGFADQSHMGRAVRRATGFSPVRLNALIKTHPAFWCYRLLGERF